MLRSLLLRLARIAAVSVVLLAAASADARGVIVKLRSEGSYAIRECAEKLTRTGRSFASAAADGSDSLDRIRARQGLGHFRTVFATGRHSLAERRLALRARHAARVSSRRALDELPDLSHVYRVALPPGASAAKVVAALRADPHVEYAQSDADHSLDQVALPNDPFLHSSGSWGQDFEDLWALFRIRAPEAWAYSQGEGIVVAVVDTGLDYEHPDILGNVFVHPGEDLNGNGIIDPSDWNGIDDDGNGFIDDLRGFDFANSEDVDGDGRYDGPDDVSDPDPFDDRGHGTHVAGTIAAVADNGIGIVGVAPKARIMPLKGFPAEGSAEGSVLWRAVLYAAENGAHVINNSWSCSPTCPENPLAEEVVALVEAMDVLIVTSAGNRLIDVVYNSPEKLRQTITVGSTGFDDLRSESFSNFGFLVDLAAPGGDGSPSTEVRIARRNILSLRSEISNVNEAVWVQNDYYRNSGTSMSSPHVAGVAALLRSQRPELRVDGVRRILRQSAEDLGPPGPDRDLGAGRLDALSALTHPPLPDLFAALSAPGPGATLSPDSLPVVEIRGTASGDALLEYELEVGAGTSPDEWSPIHRQTGPVEDGVLGRWEIRGLELGAYLIRLRVHGRDGSTYYEFLPVSLERNVFQRISSEGRAAFAPDVSGEWVVWQSRSDPDDPEESTPDMNLFATHWSTGRERVIAATEEDELSATIAGRTIAWLQGGDFTSRVVRACSLDAQPGGCPAAEASGDAMTTLRPATAHGHVFWTDGSSGESDLRRCAIEGDQCLPGESGLVPERRLHVRSDGRSLSWAALGNRFGICDLDPNGGACVNEILTGSIPALSRPTYSQGLLAWVGFSVRRPPPLEICELDAETGACAAIRVTTGVSDSFPDLDGNRLVWEAAVGDQEQDVFFCEYDPILQRCPVQRLTSHMSTQRDAAIDGDRVVWQDARTGGDSIQGIELPRLRPIPNQRVQAGRPVVIFVRPAKSHAPGDPARVESWAELPDGSPVSSLGARFSRFGENAFFRWRPRADQTGTHVVTFAATTATGITTRSSITIEVEPPRKRPRPWWWDFSRWLR